ncbi:MAG TPA: SDR family oxidoreductase [Caulobacteraceae bacterium]|nr:SDR family oxidoreductase [Caulobacteraceae bacterium]
MRNVLVTGASRGLGLAMARRLAADGFRVHAVARKASDEVLALSSETGAVHFHAFDLLDVDGLPALARRLRADFGPLYGLVNNAGIGTSGLLTTMPQGQIEALIRLNTLSPILLTRAVARSMLAQGSGRIVNVSSIVASTGFKALSVYSATKASLVGFTRSLARELGAVGVTVNAVAPGFIDTEMTDVMDEGTKDQVVRRSALRRLAVAGDVAAAVAFLLSDDARNITGTVLTVDAGATA